LVPARRIDGVFGLVDLAATSLGLTGAAADPSLGGSDRSDWIRGVCAGPRETWIRMPSVPPFPPNCPETWEGMRAVDRLTVRRRDGSLWLDETVGAGGRTGFC
jgi:hypothetical protein